MDCRRWLYDYWTTYGWTPNDIFLYGEQVCEYITEGKLVSVKGQEFLLKGKDGKILRAIDVDEILFEPMWVKEKPKVLNVPYKSEIYFTRTYPDKKQV